MEAVATEFLLPDIGDGLTEAEVVRWLVEEGAEVGRDQPLVEVETDKAVVVIPSPVAGTVIRHGASPGETMAVGAVLAVIGSPEDALSPTSRPAVSRAGSPRLGRSGLTEDPSEGDPAAVKALPVVRRLARQKGVKIEGYPRLGRRRPDYSRRCVGRRPLCGLPGCRHASGTGIGGRRPRAPAS